MAPAPKRRKQPTELPTDYVLQIERWDWSYSFGLNQSRLRPDDPYLEFRHLTLYGVLEVPRRLKHAEVELTVIPSRDLNAPDRFRHEKPLAVGSLSRNRSMNILQGYLSLPEDALHTILSMLIASRLKFVIMHGTQLGRSGATMRGYRLKDTLSEDDLYER